MGPGSFGTGKTDDFGKRCAFLKELVLQWGPVHLEPGRRQKGCAAWVDGEAGFNGARFIWNREDRYGIEKPVSLEWLQWGPVHLEPGSPVVQVGRRRRHRQLQWGPVHLEPGRRFSMAPTYRGRPGSGFNGARFIWNREDARLLGDTPRVGLTGFNGARFIWNREEDWQTRPGTSKVALQWGPVHLEPGSVAVLGRYSSGVTQASMGPGSFGTGKRLHVFREHLGPTDDFASMGPGSFGTGKELSYNPGLFPVSGLASMGPGSFGTGKRAQHDRRPRGRPASMGPGSFGTGKPDRRRPRGLGWSVPGLQWGPVHLEPGRPAGGGGGGPSTLTRFNGARFIWNREAIIP